MLILVDLGAAAGLIRNPRYYQARARCLLVVLGALIFAATNLLLSAGVRHLLERLFQRARMKEVLMLLLVAIAVLPQVAHLALNVPEGRHAIRFAPGAALLRPWSCYRSRDVLRERIGLHERLRIPGLVSVSPTGSAAWQFERTIRYDEAPVVAPRPGTHDSSTARSRLPGGLIALFRLPFRFLPDPLAALIEKELRTFARIPRFRMVYAMSSVFGLVLYLPVLRGIRESRGHVLHAECFADPWRSTA